MDIFDVIEAHNRMEAGKTLEELSIGLLSNGADAAALRRFTESVQQRAGIATESRRTEFDEEGFEALRRALR